MIIAMRAKAHACTHMNVWSMKWTRAQFAVGLLFRFSKYNMNILLCVHEGDSMQFQQNNKQPKKNEEQVVCQRNDMSTIYSVLCYAVLRLLTNTHSWHLLLIVFVLGCVCCICVQSYVCIYITESNFMLWTFITSNMCVGIEQTSWTEWLCVRNIFLHKTTSFHTLSLHKYTNTHCHWPMCCCSVVALNSTTPNGEKRRRNNREEKEI